MDIRVKDLHRAILQQCIQEVAEAAPQDLGRLVVEFMDFVLSDATADSAAAVKRVLESTEIAEWDDAAWVVPELARATLDALGAWRRVARVVYERLLRSDVNNEAIRELRERLSVALGRLEDLELDQDKRETASSYGSGSAERERRA